MLRAPYPSPSRLFHLPQMRNGRRLICCSICFSFLFNGWRLMFGLSDGRRDKREWKDDLREASCKHETIKMSDNVFSCQSWHATTVGWREFNEHPANQRIACLIEVDKSARCVMWMEKLRQQFFLYICAFNYRLSFVILLFILSTFQRNLIRSKFFFEFAFEALLVVIEWSRNEALTQTQIFQSFHCQQGNFYRTRRRWKLIWFFLLPCFSTPTALRQTSLRVESLFIVCGYRCFVIGLLPSFQR